MDAGKESEALHQIKKVLRSTSWVGQVPYVYQIHQLLQPIIGNRLALTARNGSLRDFTVHQVQSRVLRGSDHRDMLGRFVEINKAKPVDFYEAALVSMTASNIAAGSDTTAISLRSMVYYLLKNPACLNKLIAEIDEATAGMPPHSVVTYDQTSKMPYLQAVMNEAMRIHSIVGHSMQRVVPREGLQLGKYYIPGQVSPVSLRCSRSIATSLTSLVRRSLGQAHTCWDDRKPSTALTPSLSARKGGSKMPTNTTFVSGVLLMVGLVFYC